MDGSVEDVPLTSPGGLVQSGGYMSKSGPDRSPAVGISGMAPVVGDNSDSEGLGGMTKMVGSIFEMAG